MRSLAARIMSTGATNNNTHPGPAFPYAISTPCIDADQDPVTHEHTNRDRDGDLDFNQYAHRNPHPAPASHQRAPAN